MKGRRVMAVAAHPDDADFFCGGAVALWAAQGAEITYVICTDDALSSRDSKVGPEDIVPVRKKEQLCASEVLGVGETVFLDYTDMDLKFTDELWLRVTRLVRRHRPHVLMMFDPWLRYELHPDHNAAARAAWYAQLAAANPWKFSELIEKEKLVPWQVSELYLFKTDRPDTWVDIGDMLETKARALACHRSQFEWLAPDAKQGMPVLREMSKKHPDTGRPAEAFKRLPLEGMEGLKTYIGLDD